MRMATLNNSIAQEKSPALKLKKAELVRRDTFEGMISAKAAKNLYGVVLDQSGQVNTVETQTLRRQLAGALTTLQAVATESSYESGAVSRRRICRLHPDDAKTLVVAHDDLAEIDSRNAAPLRAWVRLDATVERGTLPIDSHGLQMLGMQYGQALEIRKLQEFD